MDYVVVGKMLKDAREAAGWKVGSAATTLGVRRETLWRYESGELATPPAFLRSALDLYAAPRDVRDALAREIVG
jgi:transcriptional regulator with XRE-family HTH domain